MQKKHKLVLEKRAQKDLKKIDTRFKPKILKALVYLKKDPYIGKSLSGELEGYFSLRVWPYRILYTIRKEYLIIYVIAIKHRQSSYKK